MGDEQRGARWVVAGPIELATSGQAAITRRLIDQLGQVGEVAGPGGPTIAAVVDTAAARALPPPVRLIRRLRGEGRTIAALVRHRPDVFYRSISSGGGVGLELPAALVAARLVSAIVVHHHAATATGSAPNTTSTPTPTSTGSGSGSDTAVVPVGRLRRLVLGVGRGRTTHLVMSDRMGRDLAAQRPGLRIVTLSNLAFDERPSPVSSPGPASGAAGGGGERLRVGLLAGLTVDKGVLVALETIEALVPRLSPRPITLELAGPASPEVAEAIDEAAGRGGAGDLARTSLRGRQGRLPGHPRRLPLPLADRSRASRGLRGHRCRCPPGGPGRRRRARTAPVGRPPPADGTGGGRARRLRRPRGRPPPGRRSAPAAGRLPDPGGRAASLGPCPPRPTTRTISPPVASSEPMTDVARRPPVSRSLAELVSTSAISQGLQLALLPVVASLFPPASFGVAATATSVGTIAGVLVCGNYAQAIPVPADEDEAVALTRLSAGLAVLVTAAVTVVLAVLALLAMGATGFDLSWTVVWGAPLIALAIGAYSIGSAWAVRHEHYRHLAAAAVSRGVLTPAVQIAAGLVSANPAGLVVAAAVRQAAGTVRFARSMPPWLGVPRTGARAEVLAAARRFRRFALLGIPARLLSAANLQLPAVLIAALYGLAPAGLYALAVRLTDAPVRTLADATGRILSGRVAGARRSGAAAVGRPIRRLLALLAAGGLALAVGLWLLGPPLTRLVTPDAWVGLDDVVRALAVLVGSRLLFLPLGRVLPILERQGLDLAFNLVRVVWLGVAFILAWSADWPFDRLLQTYAGGAAALYVGSALVVAHRVGER